GHLRQTSTWFFAFIDNNGDATWNGCEPAGLAQLQPHDLTYGTMPQIEVGLTDGQPGYGRFDWASFGDECCYSYTVSVVNISVAGSPQVLYRAIRNRTYVHEGDFQYAGYTGGLPYASYQWYVYKSNGGVWTSGFFNAMYPASVAAPALTRPLGAELVFAKNQLVWGMDANSTQYRLQIRRTNSATGELIFDSLLKAPFDDNGTFTANLPYYAGEWLYGRNRGFDNGAYFWRVQSVNPRTSSSYSSWGSFMINLQEAALGASTISGEAFYFGKVLSTNRAANVVVEAFADFAFSGLPEARIVLTNKSNLSYKLMGLRPGTYYVRAYIDQNVNKKLDTWESWGFVKDTTMQAVDYQPKAITVPGNAVAQWLVLRDRDTDNDRIPDAWEYLNFGSLTTAGPGPVSGYTDWDGDGLNDLREYEISFEDTDPKNVDTDGDTLSDFFEVTYSDWRQGLPADPSHYDPYDPVRNPTGTDLDPHKTDTDGDGYSDYQEIFVLNTSPTSPLDVPGAREALLRSDPYGDFDGDGFLNIEEVVLGVNPFEAVDVPRVRGATEISGLAVGEALDVVRWRVPTNITTNIQVRLAVTTNLYQNYNLIPGAQRMVYKTNWFLGPWAWTNQPGAASRMYYRLEWDVP
ncbi:MAG: hypothetical protein KKC51_05955, partial [Verrucomicrobia bacterium]|nr:hypothetical protein [Verrucomicrobiota bacterium]